MLPKLDYHFVFLTFLLVVLVALQIATGRVSGLVVNGANPTSVPNGNEIVWVEDALPDGAVPEGNWNWISNSDPPGPLSGFYSHQSDLSAGVHQHYFQDAKETMYVSKGEILVTYVYLDPLNPPSQMMLQWNNGSWEHRAYWANTSEQMDIPLGVEGTDSRQYMGPMPATGAWIRIEVPALSVGLEESEVTGMAFTLFDGQASWDRSGKYDPTLPPPDEDVSAVAAPTPVQPNEGCGSASKPEGPCQLLADLHWAMATTGFPPPHPNWERRLDWGFENWRGGGGSENWAPIAHAIALWKPAPYGGGNATLNQKINWWNTFLKCQTGGPCSVPGVSDPGQLKYLKGTELLANNYDYGVVGAVIAVNYWATRINPNQTLADNARAYLRATFALYGLAAGKEYALRRTYLYNTGESEVSNVCHTNAHGGLYYRGPFIAAAGMRSTPAWICTDFRGHLLVRALQLGVTANREQLEQTALLNFIQSKWTGNTYGENVYALSMNDRTKLIGLKDSGMSAAFVRGMLGTARTSVGYNLIGWNDPVGGQTRVSLMERNINHLTVAIYGIKYTLNTHEIHVFFPWNPGVWRSEVSKGKGELRPLFSANPTTAWATNFNPNDPDESDFNPSLPGKQPGPKHGVRNVSMPLPSSGLLYYIRLSPDGPSQCLSPGKC